jgi:hypothetical protein
MTAAQSRVRAGIEFPVFWARNAPNPWLLPWLAAGGQARWVIANFVVAILYAGLGAVVGRFFGA